VPVTRRDASLDRLLAVGGDLRVSCFRIEYGDGGVRWVYESGNIIGYLEGRFVLG